MRRILTAFLCLIGIFGCTNDRALDPLPFTVEYAAQLKSALPHSKVEIVRDLQLLVTDAAGKEQTAFLNNCYAEYRLMPKDKVVIIAKYIAAYSEVGHESEKIDASRITPVVKDKAWISEIRESMRSGGAKEMPENVYDRLNEELLIVYAEDSPKSLRYLTPKDIEQSGLKRDQLRSLAIRNLKALLPKIEVHGGNGLFMLTAGGDYEASLLLFDKIWSERQVAADGDYVVAIPCRDLLYVTGSKNIAGIAKMRELAKENASTGPYPLTSDLFIYKNGQFTRYDQ